MDRTDGRTITTPAQAVQAETPSRSAWDDERCAARLILLIGLASVALAWYAASDESLTWDEPVFIVAGLSYWQTGELRINSEAPPLAQRLLALPLLFLDLPRPAYDSPTFSAATQAAFAADYLAANAARLAQISQWARMPVWLASLCCVCLAGHWAMALYGPRGALAAALSVALSPTLMAHGRFATTDYLCATGMLAASYLLWRALRSARWRDWLLYGAAAASAILFKFTALLLLPLACLQIVYEIAIVRRPIGVIAPRAAAALLLGMVLISAAYGGLFDLRPFLAGLSHLYANADPNYHSYVLGAVLPRAVWYYYLVAFVLKTPLPALLLLGLALLGCTRHPRARELIVYLLMPAALMLAVACFDTSNLGLRRVLPALPMVALFSAQVASAHYGPWGSRLVLLALLWMAAETAFYYPYQLAYFNTLAGGPAAAPYLLDDSNIDWGQELPGLARWQITHAPQEKLFLSYFGSIAPELYGVRSSPMGEHEYRDPPPGLYALSTHKLVWLRKIEFFTHAGVDWLTRYRPIDRIGYSIYLYRFPESRQTAH